MLHDVMESGPSLHLQRWCTVEGTLIVDGSILPREMVMAAS